MVRWRRQRDSKARRGRWCGPCAELMVDCLGIEYWVPVEKSSCQARRAPIRDCGSKRRASSFAEAESTWIGTPSRFARGSANRAAAPYLVRIPGHILRNPNPGRAGFDFALKDTPAAYFGSSTILSSSAASTAFRLNGNG